MENVKRTKRLAKTAVAMPRRFIRAPQRNVPDRVLKTLHLRSMVHR